MSSTFDTVANIIAETCDMPLEQWMQEVNDGKATTEQYFVLKNLCGQIDQLVAAKSA
jgi:hypothetical protein